MQRAWIAVMSVAVLLTLSAAASAEEMDRIVKGDLVRASQQHPGSMWTIFVLPKDYKPGGTRTPDTSIYQANVSNDRGLFLISVNKDGAGKRYELMIPWHAVAVIMRETSEPVDARE